MKLYANKLYSIEGSAKRTGLTVEQIKEMIDKKVLTDKDVHFYGIYSIWGRVIPKLYAKWKAYQARISKKVKEGVTS